MIKISFTGDVALDKPLLNAARVSEHSYCFDGLFDGIQSVIGGSDCVVGNLETVFAGPGSGYDQKPLGYNSPDDFLVYLKKSGFSVFSIANNHCLDEGLDGLNRTIALCRSLGIRTAGSRDGKNDIVESIGGVRVAFLAYAQSLNPSAAKLPYAAEVVNLLSPPDKTAPQSVRQRALNRFPLSWRENAKKLLGMPTIQKVTDRIAPGMIDSRCLDELRDTIRRAKAESDWVVMLVHGGGQFNDEPGEYATYFFDFFQREGVDLIVGNHPHVIQKAAADGERVAAFSLGGLTLSPSASYVPPDCLAEYSLILHVYLDERIRKIASVTYTLVKGIEDGSRFLRVEKVDCERDENAAVLQKRIGRNLGFNRDSEIILYQRT